MSLHLIPYLALCGLLIAAIVTDVYARVLPNWLTGGVAVLAPIMWITGELNIWPDILVRLGVALVCFVLFAALYHRDLMGGGDVKLIAALMLWLPLHLVAPFLLLMSLLGGLVSVALWLWDKWRPQNAPIEVPYGVAIAGAGFWALAQLSEPFILS